MRFGCYLIIPLKYDENEIRKDEIEKAGEYRPVTTMDLTENAKKDV